MSGTVRLTYSERGEVSVRFVRPCPDCDGTGEWHFDHGEYRECNAECKAVCERCDGTGKVRAWKPEPCPNGADPATCLQCQAGHCHSCLGNGYIDATENTPSTPCCSCGGTGWLEAQRAYVAGS